MKLRERLEINETGLSFKLDEEFTYLCNDLTDTELNKLEQSIKEEGCRDALVVWKEEGILLDGHHRLHFCLKHKKPFEIKEMSHKDRFSALLWAWTNDKARRSAADCPYYDGETVIEKFKDGLVERAKERMRLSKGRGQKGMSDGTYLLSEMGTVRNELADLAGIASVSMGRIEAIMKYADEATKAELRKRKPKMSFSAVGDKLILLNPTRDDTEDDIKFKESIDKEAIMDCQSVPVARDFVKAMKKVGKIESNKQREIIRKAKEAERNTLNEDYFEEKITLSKYGINKLQEPQEHIVNHGEELKNMINVAKFEVEKLTKTITMLIQKKDEFDSKKYINSFERFGLVVSVEELAVKLNYLLGGIRDAKKSLHE